MSVSHAIQTLRDEERRLGDVLTHRWPPQHSRGSLQIELIRKRHREVVRALEVEE